MSPSGTTDLHDRARFEPDPIRADSVRLADWGTGPDGRRALWLVCEADCGAVRRIRISLAEDGRIEVERWHGATVVIGAAA